jgi:hypothetical protein
MSDIDRKRDFVTALYPHRGWAKKVERMSDTQVVAIYLHEQNKAQEKAHPKSKEDSHDDSIPF